MDFGTFLNAKKTKRKKMQQNKHIKKNMNIIYEKYVFCEKLKFPAVLWAFDFFPKDIVSRRLFFDNNFSEFSFNAIILIRTRRMAGKVRSGQVRSGMVRLG